MDTSDALTSFAALSQPTRLAVFRLLIKAGPEGLLAGEIAEQLNVRQNTMSTNLKILLNSTLITNRRDGRNIRYFASLENLQGLLGFLMDDCCGGNPEICQPVIDQIACKS